MNLLDMCIAFFQHLLCARMDDAFYQAFSMCTSVDIKSILTILFFNRTAMHEESSTRREVDYEVHEGVVPAYLLDRESTTRAKEVMQLCGCRAISLFYGFMLYVLHPFLIRRYFPCKVLSNTLKQKRKEKAGKWEVPLPKVRPVAEDEMFGVIRTGKRKSVFYEVKYFLKHNQLYIISEHFFIYFFSFRTIFAFSFVERYEI
ncbi:hypothetical protein Syun_012137 [Stephania yunnanensis]|uniref:Uncharacterized protein n=1 Tax=Stephania yunnanensis TaxID=152371 RepID=A0AAP0JZ13_9MAGN